MAFRKCFVLGLCMALPLSAFADFQYTETTKITGGAVVEMTKIAETFSKQARQAGDPVISTVLVKGNRMAKINQDVTQIIDLDKETVTHIDHVKKVYWVMTFQQMKEAFEQAMRQAQQQSAQQPASDAERPEMPEMKFNVNVRNTGADRQVAGLEAKETILSMEVQGTNKETGQTGSLAITNDMWMAPEIPGYNEVREFNRRWALKMGMMYSGAVNPLMAARQPGSTQSMAEMAKEMSKLKGVPVLQIMRMGSTPNGEPLPAASEAPLPASNSPAMPSAGEVAQKSATSAATSAVTSKLGGLAGLGGFGRKKKQESEQQEQQPAPAAAQSGAAVLMESSTELTSFSSAAIDGSRFGPPAGYQQVVASDMRQPGGR